VTKSTKNMAKLIKILWFTILYVALVKSSEISKSQLEKEEYEKTISGQKSKNQRLRKGRWIEDEMTCTDVSTYGTVKWIQVEREKCKAKFPKRTIPREKRVCQQVTTMDCKLVGYVECRMEQIDQPYRSFKMKQEYFQTKKCKPTIVEKTYTSQTAECKNVTKHNCVTQWEISPSGEKVWTSNDDCKQIVVEHCELVPIKKKFNKTETVCEKDDLIPWVDCEPTNENQRTSVMTCTPKSALECNPITKNLCTTVKWTESTQDLKQECWPDKVYKPHQDVSHKKECICPDPDVECHPPTFPPKHNSKPIQLHGDKI